MKKSQKSAQCARHSTTDTAHCQWIIVLSSSGCLHSPSQQFSLFMIICGHWPVYIHPSGQALIKQSSQSLLTAALVDQNHSAKVNWAESFFCQLSPQCCRQAESERESSLSLPEKYEFTPDMNSIRAIGQLFHSISTTRGRWVAKRCRHWQRKTKDSTKEGTTLRLLLLTRQSNYQESNKCSCKGRKRCEQRKKVDFWPFRWWWCSQDSR